jgi:hypothetical protein
MSPKDNRFFAGILIPHIPTNRRTTNEHPEVKKMRKGLRKVVISSAALFLLFALIAPSMSATSAFSETSGAPSGSSLDSMMSPTTNPVETIVDPITEPGKMVDPASVMEEEQTTSETEEFEPAIPVVDEDPGEPDNPDSPIVKVRGKSNPNGHGSGGKFKKSK